jgi:hypothetical protein
MMTKTDKRRGDGVKLSADLYRTINGEHYECWMSFPSEELIAAYRKAGIRCRRIGSELFVHVMDIDQAREIERARDA